MQDLHNITNVNNPGPWAGPALTSLQSLQGSPWHLTSPTDQQKPAILGARAFPRLLLRRKLIVAGVPYRLIANCILSGKPARAIKEPAASIASYFWGAAQGPIETVSGSIAIHTFRNQTSTHLGSLCKQGWPKEVAAYRQDRNRMTGDWGFTFNEQQYNMPRQQEIFGFGGRGFHYCSIVLSTLQEGPEAFCAL
jgi:hypothetical protein